MDRRGASGRCWRFFVGECPTLDWPWRNSGDASTAHFQQYWDDDGEGEDEEGTEARVMALDGRFDLAPSRPERTMLHAFGLDPWWID